MASGWTRSDVALRIEIKKLGFTWKGVSRIRFIFVSLRLCYVLRFTLRVG